MQVVIIGGGASGLTAAIQARKQGANVTVLERNNSCCKKILITGNGKCNYWNEDQDLKHYYSKNPELLEKIFTEERKEEVLDFFDSIGIVPKVKNGYYYPYSNQASSIKEALLLEAKLLGVKIVEEVLVSSIEKVQDYFVINKDKENIKADKVIIATGSKACPKTGSDGIGYELAKSFGHSIIPVLPSLVQLRGIGSFLKKWDGIRADVKVALFVEHKKVKEETGEIQLTDYGVSGICIFNLSGLANIYLSQNKNILLKINFVPWLETKEKFLEWITTREKVLSNRTVERFLEGFLNYKLIDVILKESNISKDKNWNELTSNERELLRINLIEFSLEITDSNSFDKAQVCSGGVPLTEINLDTFESKKVKGLYLVGEVLDVVGDCGGYNLGFAWISGMIAGKGVRE